MNNKGTRYRTKEDDYHLVWRDDNPAKYIAQIIIKAGTLVTVNNLQANRLTATIELTGLDGIDIVCGSPDDLKHPYCADVWQWNLEAVE